MPRLADTVFEFIENQKISKVFLLPGGGAMHLVDAVSRRHNLDFVPKKDLIYEIKIGKRKFYKVTFK